MARKNIVSAYLTSLLGVFSGLLTQFVFIKLLTSRVTLEEYSLYAYVFQITNYIAVLQLGLDFAVSREIAFNLGKNDIAGATYSFSFIKRYNNKLSCLALAGLVCVIFFIYQKNIYNLNIPIAKVIFITAGFGFSQVLSFYLNPYIVALIGSNNQKIINYDNLILSISATIVSSILLFKTKLGIMAMPFVLLVLNAINYFVIKGIAKNTCVFIKSKPSQSQNKQEDKRIISFALLATLGGLAWTIESTSDVFILSNAGLFSIVGLYVIWWRFPQMFFDLATRLMASAMPSLTTSFSSSEKEGNRLFNKLLLIVFCVALVIEIGTAFWLPSFINIWVGPKFFYSNYKVLAVCCAALIGVRALGNCMSMFIISRGAVKFTTKISWIQTFIKVLSGVLLTNKFGLIGLLFGSLLASLFQAIVCFCYLYKKNSLLTNSIYAILIPLIIPFLFVLTGIPYVENVYLFFLGVGGTVILIGGMCFLLIKVCNSYFNLGIDYTLFKKSNGTLSGV